MSINKNGIWKTKTSDLANLVNDFSETGTTTGWTFSGTLTNKKMVLTGASPNMTSASFTVNPKDILVVEYALAFTTLSDGSGVFIGTNSNANTNRYNYNTSTKTWGEAQSNASSSWNTYWTIDYNSTTYKAVKGYIIGSEVDIHDVPAPEGVNNAGAIQLTSGTTANIRPGYNANTGMTFELYYFRVYNIKNNKMVEISNTNVKIGKGYLHANNFIEI